ncbi:MAG: AlpA family phage regulatory protein [Holosporaceae bacterium]|jgi:predicted DNA-binding transcriptional regulator AlpA|nr:AlpA family phage regulatory protein [Holosporaceae bacterium]
MSEERIPEERFLRLPQILRLIPIGKSTLLEKVKKGEFPKQIKLGSKISVWKASEVQAYIDNHCKAFDGNEVRNG